MTAGIVLAGGRSSRFGRDKLRVTLADGRTLLAHALEPLLAVCDVVVLVGDIDGATIEGLPTGLVVVRDREAFGGPVVGILAGLEALDRAPDDVVIVAGGDMPSMEPAVLRLLADELRSATHAACARLSMEQTLSGIQAAVLPAAVRAGPALTAARTALDQGDRRLRGLLDRMATVIVPSATWRRIDRIGATVRDVDRPSDLPEAERGPDPGRPPAEI